MSREYTSEEMQKQFIDHIHNMVEYWLNEDRAPTVREKLEGLAFSILVAIDGETMALPAYKLIPISSEEDEEFYKSQGENFYPDDVDIAGSLHEKFHN